MASTSLPKLALDQDEADLDHCRPNTKYGLRKRQVSRPGLLTPGAKFLLKQASSCLGIIEIIEKPMQDGVDWFVHARFLNRGTRENQEVVINLADVCVVHYPDGKWNQKYWLWL